MTKNRNLMMACFLSAVLVSGCGGGGGGGGAENSLQTGPASAAAGEVAEVAEVSSDAAANKPANRPAGSQTTDQGAPKQVGTAAWDGQAPARANKVQLSSAGTLSQADTEYILTQDIVASGTAFEVAASKVTLNLNGHTVTYANGASGYGVHVQKGGLSDMAIVNGTIRQGAAASATNDSQAAWHAIYLQASVLGYEIAGLKIEYRTPETSAIHTVWGKEGKIHHNVLNDTGSRVINRHQLVSVIKANRASNMDIHHNEITRARQGGIDIGNNGKIHNNTIHVDSSSTNSYGISVFEVDGFTINNNTITGEGIHPIGIGMLAKTKNGKVHDNRIEMQNTASGAEYGSTGSAGMRMTWGTDKVEVWNNHITIKAQADLLGAGQDSWGRGLWVGLPDANANILFRDNTIVANNNDGKGKAAGIAVVCLNQSPGLVFRNNLVSSNWGNVVLADDYGHSGGFPQFVGNTFRREGNFDSYRTVKSDYKSYISTGVFINNRYEGGASRESIDGQFESNELKEMAFGWEYGLKVTSGGGALSGAAVKIYDNSGAEVFSGTTNEQGRIQANLVEYWATNKDFSTAADAVTRDVFGTYGNKIGKNPYTVEVSSGSARKEQKVTISSNLDAEIAL